MIITVNAGKTQFIIQNHSQKALEWEIFKGVMVVEERENIAHGFSPVSYTHLDVYKRQVYCRAAADSRYLAGTVKSVS